MIAVALALFAACSTATLVAMALPWLFDRLGAGAVGTRRLRRSVNRGVVRR